MAEASAKVIDAKVVDASLVKRLREDTSAGMMDCKRALQASGGGIAAAKAWLRKQGLAGAQAKSSRATDQGLVSLCVRDDRQAVLLELNAETDFVARNDSFQQFLQALTQRALETGSTSAEQLLSVAMRANEEVNMDATNRDANRDDSVENVLRSLIATIGENMRLRRCAYLSVERGLVASYMHARIEGEGEVSLGKIGVVLALESDASPNLLREQGKDLAKSLAMHVAAVNPSVVARSDISPRVIAHEEDIIREHARNTSSGKAPIDKIVAGRMEKFFSSVVLQEQKYALDETKSISSMLTDLGEAAGSPVRIKGFLRFALGEEISDNQ